MRVDGAHSAHYQAMIDAQQNARNDARVANEQSQQRKNVENARKEAEKSNKPTNIGGNIDTYA